MVPSRIQIFTLILSVAPLASIAGEDVRRLPAVHRPDRAWFHRGLITLGGPACKGSAEEYQRDSRTEPENAAVARCLALKALKQGPSGVAAAWRWTELDPQNFGAWMFRAVVGKDLQAARQALWLRPLDADAWNLVGSLCADAGCARGLDRDAFRTAVRLRPEFGEAWVNLAGASEVTYTPDEAQERRHAAAEGARLVPDAPFAWMFLGHSAFAGVRVGDDEATRSRFGQAAEAYVKVVELEPASEGYWQMLSRAMAGARDPALSTRLRARLKRINPARAARLP